MENHHTAPTSREAYRSLQAEGQYAAILGHLRKIYPASSCIADIATELKMERSTVSARMNELKNYGSIVYDGKRKSRRTGITAMHWKVKEQETLFN